MATSLAYLDFCDVCFMTSSQNVLLAVIEVCRKYGSLSLYHLNLSDLSTKLGDSFVSLIIFYVYAVTEDIMMNISDGQCEPHKERGGKRGRCRCNSL